MFGTPPSLSHLQNFTKLFTKRWVRPEPADHTPQGLSAGENSLQKTLLLPHSEDQAVQQVLHGGDAIAFWFTHSDVECQGTQPKLVEVSEMKKKKSKTVHSLCFAKLIINDSSIYWKTKKKKSTLV